MTLMEMGAYAGAVFGIINLLLLLKSLLSSGEKLLEDKVGKLEKKAVEYDRRIQNVENLLPHLPNKDGVHKQQLEISEMRGDIGIIKKSIEATERTTRRVEDFLIAQGHRE